MNKPGNVLFLCAENYDESRFSEVFFESEAKKVDLVFGADSKGLNFEQGVNRPGPMSDSAVKALQALKIDIGDACSRQPAMLSIEDLINAYLVVILQKRDESKVFQTGFGSWKGEVDIWKLSQQANPYEQIRQEINNLLVRLIMKGGKRQPIESINSGQTTRRNAGTSPASAAVRVSRESKKRRGKNVTVISGLTLDESELRDLAASLKQLCGTGGTVKDGKIEIQGDQRDRIMAELKERGYKPKLSGG
ncbi:MAG: hypothetical protein K8F91_18115 [Candidatus Obscuribacterales bacterium]|nr:hypothetical protein [Candidatus Obscuribacterales bacterium]